MSWQAYVDTSLVATGHVDKAAIISAAGDSTWAASPGFTISPSEMSNIVKIIAEDGSGPSVDRAFADGLHIQGERYVTFNIADRHIYGRKGREGIIIVKTGQAILVAHYGENVQAGNATQTVEALADYLIGVGY